jgi:hypothetical protein
MRPLLALAPVLALSEDSARAAEKEIQPIFEKWK